MRKMFLFAIIGLLAFTLAGCDLLQDEIEKTTQVINDTRDKAVATYETGIETVSNIQEKVLTTKAQIEEKIAEVQALVEKIEETKAALDNLTGGGASAEAEVSAEDIAALKAQLDALEAAKLSEESAVAEMEAEIESNEE